MANPQPDNGHIDIANEIANKLASYRIPGQQWQIIWVILRKTWGWLIDPNDKKGPKKKLDKIPLSQFERLTGIDRRRCYILLNKLIKKKVIKKVIKKVVTQNGDRKIIRYGFQKDYDKWILSPKKVTSPIMVTKVSPKKTPSKEKKDIKNIYIVIFDLWNAQKIIVHRKFTEKGKRALNSCLKDFTFTNICIAIQYYQIVLNSDRHYWTHKWTLEDFLKRGCSKFVPEAKPLENFLKNGKKTYRRNDGAVESDFFGKDFDPNAG